MSAFQVALLLVLQWLDLGSVVTGVPLQLFYPYGIENGDTRLQRGDDISSEEFQLNTSIAFYNRYYRSLYVNLNGHLSFDTELPDYRASLVLPIGFKVIAGFLGDIDTRASGNVFYRETKDLDLRQRAAVEVQSHFSLYSSYQPTSLFIATWEKVGYWNTRRDKVNTFQIVIVTDGRDSFALFHYLDDGMQWLQSEGKTAPTLPDAPGQAGFDSGIKKHHLELLKSGITGKFVNTSNVNVPGAWMYHIGYTDGEVKAADQNTGEVTQYNISGYDATCLEGASKCHNLARCLDFEDGFCCECVAPNYGNGEQCLEPGVPQRLSGKVHGVVNGIRLFDLDQHTYVVTSDGRAYTAISRVPPPLGTAMQTLNTIGGIIGWMFAITTHPLAKNGYMLTGGEFNRSAEVVFMYGNTTKKLTVTQVFYGHDALNNLRMDTRLEGEIPAIAKGSKVTVDDFKENYKRVAPGVIKSFSSRTYLVNDVAYRYTWNQTLTYQECPHNPRQMTDTMRLSVGRNFVVYNDNDQVVRFAMSNKMGILAGADPCRDAAQTCDEHADCIPNGETHICVCRPGYRGTGQVCQDINECEDGSTCGQNARCFNVPGSFQCQCNPGFRGDGRVCIREQAVCGENLCHESARCVYNNDLEKPMCECNPGFAGNGIQCTAIEFGCNEVDICGDHAQCVYDPEEFRHRCECMDGFSGDGVVCESVEERLSCRNCDPNAECNYDVDRMVFHCQCNPGYTGNGITCTQLDRCAECDQNAECRYEPTTQNYRCVCRPGYYGDGLRCETYDCRAVAVCDVNAQCVPDQELNSYVCRCIPGFRGDGRRCDPEGCRSDGDCDVNARCMIDPQDNRRTLCRCNPGFEGDGRTCQQRVVPCNQVDNCNQNAECVYDPDALSYRCRCRPGFDGDGYDCRRRDAYDCRRDPRICDPNASCQYNVDAYECVCNRNFRGDGRTCAPIAGAGNYLIYTQGYTLMKVPFAGTSEEPGQMLLYLPGQLAIGVDTDCSEGHMYWTDVAGGLIRRSQLDGTDVQTIMTGLGSPEGVAIDYVSRNMYFTDSELDIVGVARLDGSYRTTLFDKDLVNPRAIVVDPSRGVFYFTDWNRNEPKIEKANMDGTERTVIVSSDLGLPNGLALDTRTQQLCWGDAGTHRLECVRADGRGRRVVNSEATYPFDMAFFNGVLYWTDWERKDIPNMNRDALVTNDPLPLAIGGNGKTYGITTVHDQCPRVTNSCALNNGGCRFLCLPTPNGGRTCACPDDVDPRRCNEIAFTTRK